MKLNKNVQYGLEMVAVMKQKTIYRTDELAELVGTTQNYVEQIARKLRVAGILRSIRGPGGGYVRTNQPVSAFDVTNAVGSSFKIDGFTIGAKLTQEMQYLFQNVTI
jgi:DNA-binding IscR family transcriptional regulator